MGTAKKIVLVIVDGKSERKALGPRLSELLADENCIVQTRHIKRKNKDGKIAGGDITGYFEYDREGNKLNYREWATEEIIESRIFEIAQSLINEEAERTFSDISRIIHIIDTDGRFICPECVQYNNAKEGKATLYYPQMIKARNPKDIKNRNISLSSITRYLLEKNQVLLTDEKEGKTYEIPYAVYFMSCNLDHVLYNIQNLENDLKVKYARSFKKDFSGKPREFLAFINESDFSMPGAYAETWAEIQKDMRSLERWTNLGVLFKDI